MAAFVEEGRNLDIQGILLVTDEKQLWSAAAFWAT